MTNPTLTDPADSYDLVTLEVVKDELGIVGTASDDKLNRWIAAVSARFASACGGMKFVEEGWSELFRSHCPVRSVAVSRKPLLSITSVTEAGASIGADGYENDAYRLYRLSGDCRICWAAGATVVAYRSGFDAVPDDVADAVLSLIRHKYAAGGRDPLLRSFSIEGIGREDYWIPMSQGKVDDLPLELQPIADTIAFYRPRVMA